MNFLAFVLALTMTTAEDGSLVNLGYYASKDACTCPIGPGLDSGACPHCESALDALWRLELESEPVPCDTDWDCCMKNPAICRETYPEKYREVWGD